jgi:hypothetical protein
VHPQNDPLQLGVTCSFIPWGQVAAASVVASNDGWYVRCAAGGYAMSHIALQVGVASGNVCVAAYQSNGSTGQSNAPATQYQTSGSVSCPASGAATIALGGSCTPNLTDFLALAADNTTATFDYGGGPNTALANGLGYVQTTAFPLPAPVGTLTADAARAYMLRGS